MAITGMLNSLSGPTEIQMPAKSGTCVFCGCWRKSLHRDHIWPKYKGGSEDDSNIQLLCANCHEDKTRIDLKGRLGNKRKRPDFVSPMKRPEVAAKVSKALLGKKRPDVGIRNQKKGAVHDHWQDQGNERRRCEQAERCKRQWNNPVIRAKRIAGRKKWFKENAGLASATAKGNAVRCGHSEKMKALWADPNGPFRARRRSHVDDK